MRERKDRSGGSVPLRRASNLPYQSLKLAIGVYHGQAARLAGTLRRGYLNQCRVGVGPWRGESCRNDGDVRVRWGGTGIARTGEGSRSAGAARARLPAPRQLFVLLETDQPRRSEIRRRGKPARGRAGTAGAEGRRRLSGRQALPGRRRHLYAGREPRATATKASPRGTATISTAASPPTAKSTTWRRSRPRIRPCRCRATCASPICAPTNR